jgi:hypothetical protein
MKVTPSGMTYKKNKDNLDFSITREIHVLNLLMSE